MRTLLLFLFFGCLVRVTVRVIYTDEELLTARSVSRLVKPGALNKEN
jgi:hypothetical protein